MSLAWATLLIVGFLLPGVAFIGGIRSRERIPRELVRAGAVGEIGAALVAAVFLHLAAYAILLSMSGDVFQWLASAAGYRSEVSSTNDLRQMVVSAAAYAIALTSIGWVSGWLVSLVLTASWFRNLFRGGFTKHAWAVDLPRNRGGVVTAYVMTKVSHGSKYLMYRGALEYFHFTSDGQFSYIVLKNPYSYFAELASKYLRATEERALFGVPNNIAKRKWNYFVINGQDINNILIDKAAEITGDIDSAESAAFVESIERRTGKSGASKSTAPRPSATRWALRGILTRVWEQR